MQHTFTFTTAQMLAHWRSHRLYAPVAPAGASLSVSYTPSADDYLMTEIRCAYAHAVQEASPDELPLTDIAHELAITLSSRGIGTVTLPPGTLRVETIECSGWLTPARIATSADTALVARQANIFSRGTPSEPVAIVHPHRMILYSFPSGLGLYPTVTGCMAVRLPDPGGDFLLTPALLARMCACNL